MRKRFIFLIFPLLVSIVGCSSKNKISFRSDSFSFDTYYNDSYFLLDNREVHEEIALASHAMALATFCNNPDYSKRTENLRNLWNKEKFTNMYFSDSYYVEPGTDTIGFGISSKKINDFTLLAVAVRGGDYGGEWTSNFTIGKTGNAQGFDEASNTVVNNIDKYISDYKISGHIKVWISGYSRAGITSNMTAGKLLERTNNNTYTDSVVSYTTDDIYAYCFEPPMGVSMPVSEATGELYHGIHNFLNYNDFVPLVAPLEWGFTRYGTDHYYPDRLNDINFDETEREQIISLYHFTYGAQDFHEYTVDKWKFFDVGEEKAKDDNLPRASVHPSQGRFSRALIHEVATSGFQDRDYYNKHLQAGIRELLAAAFGLNEDIDKINAKNLVDIIFEYDFIRNLFLELESGESEQFAVDMEMLFLQIFGANEKNIDAVKKLFTDNFFFFYQLPQSFKVRKDILAQLLYRDNAMGIAIGHMPELSYTLLCACDSRFMGKKACKLNDGSYQILHIEKPMNFSLLEKNLKKEVFTYKDGAMISNHLSAEQFYDGSIDIYLPNNGDYEYIGNFGDSVLKSVHPLYGESVVKVKLPSQGTI